MRTKTQKTPKLPHTGPDNDPSRPTPVDYKPALTAISDLFSWAFDVATEDVADWTEGKRRVARARTYLLSSLRGKTHACPTEDVMFTAALLARIFEAELRLPFAEVVRILDSLELPTEVVPRPPCVRIAAPAYPESIVVRLPYIAPEDDEPTPEPIDVPRDLVAAFRRRAQFAKQPLVRRRRAAEHDLRKAA